MTILTRNHLLMFVLALPLVFAVACGEDLDEATQTEAEAAQDPEEDDDSDDEADAEEDSAQAADGERADWPETIQYGLLPSGDETELLQDYEPFEAYMESCFDHPFDLFTGTDYVSMIEAMREDHVHIASFGPFAYVLANQRADAEAFVQGAEDEDSATYHAFFISLERHGFEEVTDLEGETFGFVDASSASGHIFPRAYMSEQLDATSDELESRLGDVVFTGGHEQAGMAVLNEEISAAVISENTWITNMEDGDDWLDHPNADELFVLDTTDEIPRRTEAYKRDLPDSLIETANDCFSNALEDGGSELEDFWATHNYPAGFIPADDGTFDVVREAADALGMSPEELLED